MTSAILILCVIPTQCEDGICLPRVSAVLSVPVEVIIATRKRYQASRARDHSPLGPRHYEGSPGRRIRGEGLRAGARPAAFIGRRVYQAVANRPRVFRRRR